MHFRLGRLRVLGGIEIKAVLLKVEHGGSSWGTIEQVSQVFKSDKDHRCFHWEEVDLEVAIEFSDLNFRDGSISRDSITLSFGNEECNRLVNLELHLALLGGNFSVVKELNEVAGIDLNAHFVRVFLVKRFTNTTAIIVQETPVLHDLDDTIREN